MSDRLDSSAKPLDETIPQQPGACEILDWLVRYDEGAATDDVEEVTLGATITDLAPEAQITLDRLRECIDLLAGLRSSSVTFSDSDRVKGQQVVDHWLITGRRDPIDLATRAVHIGRYRLLQEIGRGGYGVVFIAHDPCLGRNVAVKLPLPEVLLTEGAKSRFTSEALAAASLDHTNVLRVFDAGEDGPICYIVSEYCAGPTLQKWLAKRDSRVPPRLAARIVASLAEAVAHAHSRGILHRDLKPGNVLLQHRDENSTPGDVTSQVSVQQGRTGTDEFPFEIKLADFGIAKCFDDDGTKTATGMVLGTGAYMAPEQATAKFEEICRATDVYGLGAILYELLSGRKLFESNSYADTLLKVVSQEPAPIRESRPDVPRDLEAICLKCVEKQPANRYASAGELASELKRFLDGKMVKVRPAGIIQKLGKIYRRQSRAMKTVLGILAVGWLIAFALILIFPQDPPRPKAPSTAVAFDYFDDIRAAFQLWKDNADRHQRIPHISEAMEVILERWIPRTGQADRRGFEWHYLWRLAHPEQFVEPLELVYQFPAHMGDAYFVVFSPDGKKLATAGADGVARIWDVQSRTKLHDLSGHQGGVNWVEFSPDGRPLIVTAGDDGTVRLWDSNTGQEIRKIGQHTKEVVAATFSPTAAVLAAGGKSGVLALWDVNTGASIKSTQADDDRITSISWSPDGTRIATSGSAQKIWDAAKLIHFAVHTGQGADSVAYSPDGELLAMTSGVNSLQLDDVRMGTHYATWGGFTDAHFQSVRFSADGRSLFAVGDNPDLILVCDIATRRSWNAGPNGIKEQWCVAASPDNVHLATSGRDGTVRVWKQNVGPQWTMLGMPGNRPLQLSCPSDLPMVAGVFTSHPDDHAADRVGPEPNKHGEPLAVFQAWDYSGRWPTQAIEYDDRWMGAFAYAADGKTIAIGSRDEITLLHSTDGNRRSHIPFPGLGRVRKLAWLPDRKTLVALTNDNRTEPPLESAIQVISLESGIVQLLERGPRNFIGRTAFSDDGRKLAIPHADRIDIHDTEQRKVVASIRCDGIPIMSLDFSHDQSQLAVGRADSEVHVWKIGSDDDPIIWDIASPSEIDTVHFVGKGDTIAAHSAAGRFVRLWSLSRQAEVFSLPLPIYMSSGPKINTGAAHPLWQRIPYQFAVSADGSLMVFAEEAEAGKPQRRTIYFWDGRPQAASQRVPRVRPAIVSSKGEGKWSQ